MKIYEIIDAEEKMSIGCLLCFEKEKSVIIELQENLDEWTAPLLFVNAVKKGRFTIGRDLSRTWIRGRIVPGDRQNISSILANSGMKMYDEISLLVKASGKCSQDSLYIKKINALPQYVCNRMQHNLVECVPCGNYSLLCFFADGMVKKISLMELKENAKIQKLMSNGEVYRSAHIAAGGYCVTFNDTIDIEAYEMYGLGTEIPLSLDDFMTFVKANVLDSSECCAIMECSRQNLTNYLSKKALVPIKQDVKGNLYTKGNIYTAIARQ